LLKNRKHIAIMVTADGTRIPHVTTAIFWKSYRKKKYIIIKSLKIIRALNVVNAIPQLQVSLQLWIQSLYLKVDTRDADNSISLESWKKLAITNCSVTRNTLSTTHYNIDILGICKLTTKLGDQQEKKL